MDKLAKRAGVGMLIVIAAAGSAFALGLARFASALETDSAPLKLAATLDWPKTPAIAQRPVDPAQLPEVLVVGAANAANPRAPNAVGAPPRNMPQRPAAPPKVEEPRAIAESEPEAARPSDMLDLDFGATEREAKLADRGHHAFTARQLGGAEEKHRTFVAGEHVTFETDLGRPSD
jgi:hypothetical protein